MMPLDKRLNKDIHEAVNQHYVLTNDLPKDDPRRFGLETPRQVARSYARIWDPDTGVAPSPERIAHDFLQVFEDAVPRIVEGKGICNKIAGRRHAKGNKKNEKWKGPRKMIRADSALRRQGRSRDHMLGYGIRTRVSLPRQRE